MRTSLRTAFWLTRRRWTHRLSLAHCKAIVAAVEDAVVALACRRGRTVVDCAAGAARRWLSLAHWKANVIVVDDAVVARAHRWDALAAATRWDERLSLALCKANVTVVDDAVVARAHRWDALAAATLWDQRLSLAI